MENTFPRQIEYVKMSYGKKGKEPIGAGEYDMNASRKVKRVPTEKQGKHRNIKKADIENYLIK